MIMDCPDYYALLGVPRFYATQEEIRTAYLAQIKFFHPDAGNVPPVIATDKTQLLNHIYAILRDPERKRLYDEQLFLSIQKEEILRQQAERAAAEEKARQEMVRREEARIEHRNKILCCCIGVAAVLFISVVAILASRNNNQSPAVNSPSQSVSPNKPSTPIQSSSPSPSPSLTPFPRPINGKLLTGSGLNRVAPLSISTVGSDDYYVKLVSVSTGNTVVAFYVHGGSSVTVDVPLGTYKLRYACGETWYGPKNLFGTDTMYYEADDLFPFEDMGTYYSGWTVELYLQHNGNLDVDTIDASDF